MALSQTSSLAGSSGRIVAWKHRGFLMAITFATLQMLNEVGAMMAIPLYQSMSLELNLSPGDVSWALLVTVLTGAASIAILAKAGDLYGHRRVLVLCLLVIIAGYVVSALATDFTVLIIGRALTGVTAGQALIVGIMNYRLTGYDRKKAFGLIAGAQAIGITLGFGLGGFMIEVGATWRTSFWCGGILTVICLVAMLLWGSDSDAASQNKEQKRHLDYFGTILLGLSLAAVCIGISQSTAWGPFSAATLTFILLGLVGLLGWLKWESKAKDPLVDLSLLFSSKLLPAYGIFLALGIAGIMILNFVMGWAQTPSTLAGYGFGLSPLVAGFLFIPMTAAGILVARLIPNLLHRLNPRGPFVGAGALLTLSFVWLYFTHDSIWGVLVGIFFYGAAFTALITIAMSIIAAQAPAGKGAATASLYVCIALSGSSIGTAVYAAIIGLGATPTNPIPSAGNYSLGFAVAGAASLIALISALFLSKKVELKEIVSH